MKFFVTKGMICPIIWFGLEMVDREVWAVLAKRSGLNWIKITRKRLSRAGIAIRWWASSARAK